MKGRVVSALIVGWLVASVGAEQGRPIFTGHWKIVGDKSTPANRGALGEEFRITQEANALVLEVPRVLIARMPDGATKLVPHGLSTPMVYKLDDGEHSLPVKLTESTPEGTVINSLLGGPYRTSWKDSTLTISGSELVPYSSFSKGIVESVRRLFTLSFSLNPDGTLAVERTMERDPTDKGQIEIKKAELRSVYRKTS